MSNLRKSARHNVKKTIRKIEADANYIKAQIDELLSQARVDSESLIHEKNKDLFYQKMGVVQATLEVKANKFSVIKEHVQHLLADAGSSSDSDTSVTTCSVASSRYTDSRVTSTEDSVSFVSSKSKTSQDTLKDAPSKLKESALLKRQKSAKSSHAEHVSRWVKEQSVVMENSELPAEAAIDVTSMCSETATDVTSVSSSASQSVTSALTKTDTSASLSSSQYPASVSLGKPVMQWSSLHAIDRSSTRAQSSIMSGTIVTSLKPLSNATTLSEKPSDVSTLVDMSSAGCVSTNNKPTGDVTVKRETVSAATVLDSNSLDAHSIMASGGDTSTASSLDIASVISHLQADMTQQELSSKLLDMIQALQQQRPTTPHKEHFPQPQQALANDAASVTCGDRRPGSRNETEGANQMKSQAHSPNVPESWEDIEITPPRGSRPKEHLSDNKRHLVHSHNNEKEQITKSASITSSQLDSHVIVRPKSHGQTQLQSEYTNESRSRSDAEAGRQVAAEDPEVDARLSSLSRSRSEVDTPSATGLNTSTESKESTEAHGHQQRASYEQLDADVSQKVAVVTQQQQRPSERRPSGARKLPTPPSPSSERRLRSAETSPQRSMQTNNVLKNNAQHTQAPHSRQSISRQGCAQNPVASQLIQSNKLQVGAKNPPAHKPQANSGGAKNPPAPHALLTNRFNDAVKTSPPHSPQANRISGGVKNPAAQQTNRFNDAAKISPPHSPQAKRYNDGFKKPQQPKPNSATHKPLPIPARRNITSGSPQEKKATAQPTMAAHANVQKAPAQTTFAARKNSQKDPVEPAKTVQKASTPPSSTHHTTSGDSRGSHGNSNTSSTVVKLGKQPPKIVRRKVKDAGTALPVHALEPLKIERSGEERVLISELQSPSSFWIQLLRHDDELNKLQKDLNSFYNTMKKGDACWKAPPTAGQVVAALWRYHWYRARVVAVFNKGAADNLKTIIVEVMYVDYGNRHQVTLEQMRPLHEKFTSMPCFAIPCALFKIPPNAEQVTKQVTTLMTRLINIDEVDFTMCDVDQVDRCPLTFVKLHVSEETRDKLLRGASMSGQPSDLRSLADVFLFKLRVDGMELTEVARLVNDRLEKTTYPLENRCVKSVLHERRLHELHHAELLGVPAPKRGLPHASQQQAQKSIFREERHTQDDQPPHDRQPHDPLSRDPQPQDPQSISLHPSHATLDVASAAGQGDSLVTSAAAGEKLDHSSSVSCDVERKNASIANCNNNSEKNSALGDVTITNDNNGRSGACALKPTFLTQEVSLDGSGSFRCIPCYAPNPSELWVHAVQSYSAHLLKDITTGLNECYADSSVIAMNRFYKTDFQTGQLVCACYDGEYYRAEILDIRHDVTPAVAGASTCRTVVDVFYVDFGNREVVDLNEILPLPPRFSSTPGQAVKCCLYGVSPTQADTTSSQSFTWSEKAIAYFQDVIDMEKTYVAYVMQRCDVISSSSGGSGGGRGSLSNTVVRSSDASPLQVAVVDTDNSTCDVWINENMAAVARFVDSEDYRQLQSSHYVHDDDDADSASRAVAANDADATVAAACNDDDDMMGEWNPMRSEFLADENCYHVDNEDPAVQSTNYSGSEDTEATLREEEKHSFLSCHPSGTPDAPANKVPKDNIKGKTPTSNAAMLRPEWMSQVCKPTKMSTSQPKSQHVTTAAATATHSLASPRQIALKDFVLPKPRQRSKRDPHLPDRCTDTRVSKRCIYCAKIDRSGKMQSTKTKQSLVTRSHAYCNTCHCVFCLTCALCKRQFVGFNEGFMLEVIDRHSDYVINKSLPTTPEEKLLALHFREGVHKHDVDPKALQYHVIEFPAATNREPLHAVAYWQRRLGTLAPHGLNYNDDLETLE